MLHRIPGPLLVRDWLPRFRSRGGRLLLAQMVLLPLLLLLAMTRPAQCQMDPPQQPYLAGAAKIDITPDHPTLLAGYGSRTEEHEAVEQRLWARALALGEREASVVIAVDNCGVPAAIVAAVSQQLEQQTGLPRHRLVIAATHTHNAPTLPGYAPILWAGRAHASQFERVDRYAQWLTERLVEVGAEALAARRPATLAWGQGRVRFGGNRRVLQDGKWVGFGHQEDGPVDHSLPVLIARDAEGKITAVWTNYACHCTTLGSRNTIAGDWAGHANELMEQAFPDAVVLTTIGCGADVGPQPTGSPDFARQHGQQIAAEVQRLVSADGLVPLRGALRAARQELRLPLTNVPTRDELLRAANDRGFEAEHARWLLAELERDGQLRDDVPYEISTWHFGDELAIVFLAGEVAVDYAVRLKCELDWKRLWINGWSNDVPCYIPSRRLLAEGGYEADFSMIYYAQPGRFAPEVEDVLVAAVKQATGEAFTAPVGMAAPDFLRPPGSLEVFSANVRSWAAALNDPQRAQWRPLLKLAEASQPGFTELVHNDGSQDRWIDYSGRQRPVHTLRQQQIGAELRWRTAEPADPDQPAQVFVLLGGLGYTSQPATDGFTLRLDGNDVLHFDITREVHTWESDDARVRLHYFPTWTSAEDSAGLFYVEVRETEAPAQAHELGVISRGSGSLRWFTLHPENNVAAVESVLVTALKGVLQETPQ